MVIYLTVYNLSYFGHYRIQAVSGFWLYFARTTANLFIFLVGVSLYISYIKARKIIKDNRLLYLKYLIRGSKIFCWGMLITAITWLIFKSSAVIFGILHLIGISVIIAYPFLKMNFWNLPIGIILIILGAYIKGFSFDFPWLLWIGFKPKNFYTLDYFPLLPWFGVILIGIFVGSLLYEDKIRKYSLIDFSGALIIKSFSFL